MDDYWKLENWKLGRDKTNLSCLVANSVHTADTDKAKQFCLVLSRMWTLYLFGRVCVLQFYSNMPKVKWVVLCGFCSKFLKLSSGAKIWKSVKISHNYREFKGGNLLEKEGQRIVWSQCTSVTCESIDLETLFLPFRYIFRISKSCLHVKVIESSSRSQAQKSIYELN